MGPCYGCALGYGLPGCGCYPSSSFAALRVRAGRIGIFRTDVDLLRQAETRGGRFRYVPRWLWRIPFVCRIFPRAGGWFHGRDDAWYQHGPVAITANDRGGRSYDLLGLSYWGCPRL